MPGTFGPYRDPTGHVPVSETTTPTEPYDLVSTLERVRAERDALESGEGS